jgi:hypothetical protein
MTPVELNMSNELNLKIMDLLTKWLISYITPADIISKGDGSLIGGSSNYEAQLFKYFSGSIQGYIARELEKIIDKVLEWNGFKKLGLHSQVIMKPLVFDDAQLDFKIAQEILAAQKSGITTASLNEFRQKANLEDADIKFLLDAQEEWKQITIVPIKPAGSSEDPLAADEGSLNLRAPSIGMKANQGKVIKTIEEIRADCEKELKLAWAKFIESVEASA